MSYYFTILSPTDVPLFNIAFGTSKSGGDGIARFRFPDTAQYMNQFIIHSSLDVVEEAQWMNGNMYLKHIDTYPPASAYISAFLTPSGARFLLLHQPPQLPSNSTGAGSSVSVAANPTSPQTEEAVRQFMTEVYENYVKTVMSPFYRQGMEIKSSVFRGRVTAAGRKWL
ncbi:Sedlin [Aspergillus sclerotioniger CBS 115572]|uniref:Sedlin n=1 Tax=Aspergillus sclerotioniger CBS 115572 TaxID=1450535 RepID=A0A317X6S0_9EURO|nr:Sedlin [Aspergillus sclerotioniger CBS 115572]PWY93247.1 Sedlin [Aspergillus sclerotioniger CBS 115572]